MTLAIHLKAQRLESHSEVQLKSPRSLVELATNAAVLELFKNPNQYYGVSLPDALGQKIFNRGVIEMAKRYSSCKSYPDNIMDHVKRVAKPTTLELDHLIVKERLNLNHIDVFPGSERLHSASFIYTEITGKMLQFDTTSLNTIDLSHCACSYTDFKKLGRHLPNLKVLNLSHFCLDNKKNEVSEELASCINVIVTLNPTIETLLTAYSNLPPDEVLMIPKVTQLKNLSFDSGPPNPPFNFIRPAITFLDSLEIWVRGDENLQRVTFASTRLQRLSLINHKEVDDLPVNMCNLTYLNVEPNIDILKWKTFVKHISDHCTTLTTLSISYGFNVHLNLGGAADTIFNAGLQQLTSLTKLTSFSLLRKDPMALQSFTLREGGLKFVESLHSLKSLEIRANELSLENLKYARVGMESLMLKPFKLSENDDFCMNELARLTTLTHLGVLFSENFYTPGFISQLNDKLPQLISLSVDDKLTWLLSDYRERRINKEGNMEPIFGHTLIPFSNWQAPDFQHQGF